MQANPTPRRTQLNAAAKLGQPHGPETGARLEWMRLEGKLSAPPWLCWTGVPEMQTLAETRRISLVFRLS